MDLRRYFSFKKTPQSRPMRQDQVKNNAGGYAWQAGDMERVRRFLLIGTEGGTYYVDERQLTIRNAQHLQRMLSTAETGMPVIQEIHDISTQGRAPKQDPALFALAMALASPDEQVRKRAAETFPAVVRTGTHLFQVVHYLEGFRGWGRLVRKTVQAWYLTKAPHNLVYQVVKYQGRTVEGARWTHRDVLRLAHPKAEDEQINAVLRWAVGKEGEIPDTPELARLRAYEQMMKKATNATEVVRLIKEHNLTWEFVPGQWLNERKVWEALLPNLPYTALMRNLGRLSALGILAPFAAESGMVAETLANQEHVRAARVHPLSVLVAQRTYRQGHGMRGSLKWQPVGKIIEALETAFYASFQNVEPSGKRLVVALDVSGSMGWGNVGGTPLTPREVAAAMAMQVVRTEPNVHVVAFSDRMVPFPVSKVDSLQAVVDRMDRMPFGGTDCALPMLWAMQNRVHADGFMIYTDSETWYGNIHPAQALQQYRNRFERSAKLVTVGIVTNKFTIADPNDPGMVDVVGFDTATPRMISEYMKL